MQLKSVSVVNRPLDEVYNLVRDDLPKLVPYLPNVDKIEEAKVDKTGKGVDKTNHWYAKAEIPSMVKKFISPEIMSWKDKASWDDEGRFVDYELESFLGNDLFDAKGRNTFKDLGDGTTELTITCDLEVYPSKVPGVPRLLAGKAKPMIEGLIEKLLGPNLTSLGSGLNKYFENQ